MIKYTPSAKVYERYMDASIELFMECYAETISVASNTDIREQEAPQLNEKCKALIKATHRRQKLLGFVRGIRRVLKSAAVLAIAILSLSSVLFVTVEAVRTPILNFYIKQNDGNWELSNKPFGVDPNGPDHSSKGSFNEQDPLGDLISDDFHLYSRNGALADTLIADYRSGDEYIYFKSIHSDTTMHINSEKADVEHIDLAGYDAIFSSRYDSRGNMLAWYNSDIEVFLYIDTNGLSKEELINIAMSINNLLSN